jgi:DNA-directed RNA polymerase subunit RPC12/RpoP
MGTRQQVIKKFCASCAREQWHNESGKKDGAPRCTYCGSPVPTSIVKKEHLEGIRRKQIAKLGKLV